MIHIYIYASYRERLGFDKFDMKITEGIKIGVILTDHVFNKLPNNALFAINKKFATKGDILKDGDELAIMPPVSGG